MVVAVEYPCGPRMSWSFILSLSPSLFSISPSQSCFFCRFTTYSITLFHFQLPWDSKKSFHTIHTTHCTALTVVLYSIPCYCFYFPCSTSFSYISLIYIIMYSDPHKSRKYNNAGLHNPGFMYSGIIFTFHLLSF